MTRGSTASDEAEASFTPGCAECALAKTMAWRLPLALSSNRTRSECRSSERETAKNRNTSAATAAVHSCSGSRRPERPGTQHTRQTLSPKTAISNQRKLRNNSIVFSQPGYSANPEPRPPHFITLLPDAQTYNSTHPRRCIARTSLPHEWDAYQAKRLPPAFSCHSEPRIRAKCGSPRSFFERATPAGSPIWRGNCSLFHPLFRPSPPLAVILRDPARCRPKRGIVALRQFRSPVSGQLYRLTQSPQCPRLLILTDKLYLPARANRILQRA